MQVGRSCWSILKETRKLIAACPTLINLSMIVGHQQIFFDQQSMMGEGPRIPHPNCCQIAWQLPAPESNSCHQHGIMIQKTAVQSSHSFQQRSRWPHLRNVSVTQLHFPEFDEFWKKCLWRTPTLTRWCSHGLEKWCQGVPTEWTNTEENSKELIGSIVFIQIAFIRLLPHFSSVLLHE